MVLIVEDIENMLESIKKYGPRVIQASPSGRSYIIPLFLIVFWLLGGQGKLSAESDKQALKKLYAILVERVDDPMLEMIDASSEHPY